MTKAPPCLKLDLTSTLGGASGCDASSDDGWEVVPLEGDVPVMKTVHVIQRPSFYSYSLLNNLVNVYFEDNQEREKWKQQVLHSWNQRVFSSTPSTQCMLLLNRSLWGKPLEPIAMCLHAMTDAMSNMKPYTAGKDCLLIGHFRIE